MNKATTTSSGYSADQPVSSPSDLTTPLTPAVDDPAHLRMSHLRGKRVAMVMFSFPGDPRPRRAVEALISFGMSVDLICLAGSGNDPSRDVLNGIEIRRVSIKHRRGGVFAYVYEYLAFLLISSLVLARRSLTRRYDLVYVHNMPDILVLSGLIPKAFGAKIILDLHDPMPELLRTIFDLSPEAKNVRLLKFVEKWSIRLADSVVTVNEACAKLFASRSCPSQKITVVMNSPDEMIFQLRSPCTSRNTQAASKPFVMMYHGSLVERNGLNLAVDALARVRPSIPAAELRVYGPHTPFLKRVMDSVRSQGLERAVHYLGPMSQERIVEEIEACDVGIIPNQRSIFTELNTPTRIFEYLAVGKPVIAPRAQGICDYFAENSLVFFELGDVEDLARKMKYVFHHPDEVKEIARRGQGVQRAHSWREERLKLMGLVAELLPDGDGGDDGAIGTAQRSQHGSSPEDSQW